MKLHVRRGGEGPRTALLVHGGAQDGRTWDAVAARLTAAGYRIVAPDLRGHGRSPRGDYTDPYALAADLVESVPAGVDLALGHSLGGLLLSLAAPSLRPARLVLVEPGFDQEIVPPDHFARMRAAFPPDPAGLRERHPGWTDAAIANAVDAGRLLDLDLLTAMPAFRGRDYRPANVTGPALLVLGADHSMVEPATAVTLRERGFLVRRVAGAGHDVFHDAPEGFFRALTGFV